MSVDWGSLEYRVTFPSRPLSIDWLSHQGCAGNFAVTNLDKRSQPDLGILSISNKNFFCYFCEAKKLE